MPYFSSQNFHFQAYCWCEKSLLNKTTDMPDTYIKLSQAIESGCGFSEEIGAVAVVGKILKTACRLCSIVASSDLLFASVCSTRFLLTNCFLLPCPSLLLVLEHYQMSVLESAPISSTVGRVVAKDMDEGINAEMKYSLVDGDGLDVFDINTDPNYQVGIITVRKVVNFPFYSNFYG